MSRLDELPPDQRAALSLLLRQRKSHGEVAQMLGLAERAVHDRAHAALAVLAPRQARALTPAQREEIGDYLLDQQPGVAERLRTRALLLASEPAREWAQALTDELSPLAAGALPEIPQAGVPDTSSADVDPADRGAPEATRAGAAAASAARGRGASTSARAAAAGEPDSTPGDGAFGAGTPSSSRRGGALLLAGIVAAVVVAVILITSGGGSSSSSKGRSAKTSSSAATKTGPTVSAQLSLHSPTPGSRTVGVVAVLSEKSKHAFYIEAQNLPATHNFYYAIWLYNSPSSAEALSKSPPVGSTHKLAGGSTLPSNAGEYKEILLTRETSSRPARPGAVVLRGPFKLGS